MFPRVNETVKISEGIGRMDMLNSINTASKKTTDSKPYRTQCTSICLDETVSRSLQLKTTDFEAFDKPYQNSVQS